MSDQILIDIKQLKSEHTNAVRIYLNEEFIDEFDTTPEFEKHFYEVDLNYHDLNNLSIQVLNSKTKILNNKPIGSNTIILNPIEIVLEKQKEKVYRKEYFNFVREKDPVFEIYAKQKDIEYNNVNLETEKSSGQGSFMYDFAVLFTYNQRWWLDIDVWSTSPRHFNTPRMYGKEDQQKDFTVFEKNGALKYPLEQCVELTLERLLEEEKVEELDNFKINIRKLLKRYEN